jgi:aspartate/methionine/tyrosine aminotransferase
MTPIGVEKMGAAADLAAAGSLLRLENLDTDLLPAQEAIDVTARELRNDDANSYLPFFGQDALRRAAAALVARNGGLAEDHYDWRRQCFISAGGLSGILNVLLALIEPGDEVVMTSPTYVGLINRVKLAGGVPRYVDLVHGPQGWRLDLGSLEAAVTERTRAFLMMSPSMPTGAVLDRSEWEAVCASCERANAWMIYDSAMERILFRSAAHINPLQFPGMAERTVTVGAVSKEYRMIGWRVGWVVCPMHAAEAIGRAAISNVVCPVGLAQQGAAAAIAAHDDGITRCTAIWQERHDLLLSTLGDSYHVIPAHGGWSMLVDCAPLKLTGAEVSRRLLDNGVAATSMENWGKPGVERYLRLVFANEPLERIALTRERFDRALDT